jgi:hypothetical protein
MLIKLLCIKDKIKDIPKYTIGAYSAEIHWNSGFFR